MADTLSTVSLPGAPLIPGVAAAAPQQAIELAQQPPAALLLAATLAAIVVGRGGNGALLLRTDYGTLALKTPLSLPAGSRVDLKLLPGPPPTVVLLHIEAPGSSFARQASAALPEAPTTAASPQAPASTQTDATEAPPARLALGNEVEATVNAPPSNDATALPAGTRLVLRVVVPEAGASAPPSFSTSAPARFAATVAAAPPDAAGKTVLDTPLGTLTLDRRLALPVGTTLDVTEVAILPTAASSDRLDTATVVPARVLASPGDAAVVLPIGSRIELRLQALPGPGTQGAELTGMVVAAESGETLLDTPLGLLALERRLSLPAGALVAFEPLASAPPEQPAEVPLAQRTSWPALEETLATLDRTLPALAARLRSDLSPVSGQQLAGTLLFLMSALNSGAWPGDATAAALDAAGRRDLRLKLDGDVTELRQLTAPQSGDWNVYLLPLLDGAVVRPVRLFLRRRQTASNSGEQGTRFVLEVEMSRMGALQLDGLVRSQRFDLVLRSHRAVPVELRQELAEVFRSATAAAGLAGDMTFTTASRFAVAPLEALAAHIGVTA